MHFTLLLLTLGLVSDVVLGSDSLRARRTHASLASRRNAPVAPVENSNTTPVEFNAQPVKPRISKRRNTKRCKVPPTSTASHPASTSKAAPKASPKPAAIANPESTPKASTNNNGPSNNNNAPAPSNSGGSKLSQIKNMHAFAGFVYAISSCPSKSKAASDFANMKKMGARTVITFDICQDGDMTTLYSNMIAAAQEAGIMIIPLIPTLSTNIQSNTNAVVSAVKSNPGPVLAVALGDEPLFDNDFGSVGSITSAINSIKGQLSSHGIPVSISDMAFGWQQAGNIGPLADAVDFFMMNNFPYFAGDAGNGDNAWKDFSSDISYFEGISQGKPLLVTQTGWPSDQSEFQSNSATASVTNEHKFYSLLDSHCSDFFKPKNIGWMWRSYDNGVSGWGVLDANGNPKFNANARTNC